MIELFGITRAGYLSEISPAVKQVTGIKPITNQPMTKLYSPRLQ